MREDDPYHRGQIVRSGGPFLKAFSTPLRNPTSRNLMHESVKATLRLGDFLPAGTLFVKKVSQWHISELAPKQCSPNIPRPPPGGRGQPRCTVKFESLMLMQRPICRMTDALGIKLGRNNLFSSTPPLSLIDTLRDRKELSQL